MKIDFVKGDFRGTEIIFTSEDVAEEFQLNAIAQCAKSVGIDGFKHSLSSTLRISVKDGEFLIPKE